MKAAPIGISGPVGSRSAAELLARGFSLTGIERNSGKAVSLPGVIIKKEDASVVHVAPHRLARTDGCSAGSFLHVPLAPA
jgi:putative NADH-flavin reductase